MMVVGERKGNRKKERAEVIIRTCSGWGVFDWDVGRSVGYGNWGHGSGRLGNACKLRFGEADARTVQVDGLGEYEGWSRMSRAALTGWERIRKGETGFVWVQLDKSGVDSRRSEDYRSGQYTVISSLDIDVGPQQHVRLTWPVLRHACCRYVSLACVHVVVLRRRGRCCLFIVHRTV
jgi:hypothetical protein